MERKDKNITDVDEIGSRRVYEASSINNIFFFSLST